MYYKMYIIQGKWWVHIIIIINCNCMNNKYNIIYCITIRTSICKTYLSLIYLCPIPSHPIPSPKICTWAPWRSYPTPPGKVGIDNTHDSHVRPGPLKGSYLVREILGKSPEQFQRFSRWRWVKYHSIGPESSSSLGSPNKGIVQDGTLPVINGGISGLV